MIRAASSLTRGTMYNWRVTAIMNALEKAGRATGPLQLGDLTALGHLDQYHYLGTEACDHVIKLLGIQADASVLDIGAGIGGPARYLSAHTGCRVVGVELQEELSAAAAELTSRVEGLADRVAFVTGDFSSSECALPQVKSSAHSPNRQGAAPASALRHRLLHACRRNSTTSSHCLSSCTCRTAGRCCAAATSTLALEARL